MLDLIIVTGATKGIGSSITSDICSICKNIIVIGSSDKVFNIKTTNNNCRIIPLQLDLCNYQNVEDQIKKTVRDLCDLELIKNVGIVLCGAQLGNSGGLLNSNLENWDEVFSTNIFGNLAVVKGFLRNLDFINGFLDYKLRIAFFAGGGAAYAYPEFSAYALSKVAVVRAAENLSVELSKVISDVSVISVAPGAIATDTLAKVIANGGQVLTKTDISEPTNFIHKFINDELDSKAINGRFIHVRDDLKSIDFSNQNILKLRRIS
jgi:NADP-dependent 3-hydroxy acid dehydrogenase YdfG